MSSDLPQLCKQVSFETPSPNPTTGHDYVFCFDVPIPDLPPTGAKIKVSCAGVCYKRKTDMTPAGSASQAFQPSPSASVIGIRDASLFPGFEVAGVVNGLGQHVPSDCGIEVGDRVIVYPHSLALTEGTYAEYISIMDVKNLVKIPDKLSMQVACMLPTGALWALNAAEKIDEHVTQYIAETGKCSILIVGTGGLSLWLMRIMNHLYKSKGGKVKLVIGLLKDEAVYVAQAHSDGCGILSWSESTYEESLIERTINACGGTVDIIIDFAPTPRMFKRSLDCISENGILVLGSEANEGLFKRFESVIKKKGVRVESIEMGTLQQLQELVKLVSENEVKPPVHKVFRVESAADVMEKLTKAQIEGRAVLEFADAAQ